MLVLILDMINSNEQNQSLDCKSFSINHKIPHIIWKLDVHYHVHNSPQFVPTLRQSYIPLTLILFKIHVYVIPPSQLQIFAQFSVLEHLFSFFHTEDTIIGKIIPSQLQIFAQFSVLEHLFSFFTLKTQ
jgi:hypothetical protein